MIKKDCDPNGNNCKVKRCAFVLLSVRLMFLVSSRLSRCFWPGSADSPKDSCMCWQEVKKLHSSSSHANAAKLIEESYAGH